MNYQDVVPGSYETQAFGCTSFEFEWYRAACPWPHRFHDGVDLGANCGKPIYCVGSGVVKATGQTWIGSDGLGPQSILVAMDDSNFAGYGHCVKLVNVGQRVEKGQHIANVDTLGNSTGCHLHLLIASSDRGPAPIGNIDPASYVGPGAPVPEPVATPLYSQGGQMIQILSTPAGDTDVLVVGTDGQLWWRRGRGLQQTLAGQPVPIGGNGAGGVRSFSCSYWSDYSHIDIALINLDGSVQGATFPVSGGGVSWGPNPSAAILIPLVHSPGDMTPQ